MALGRDFVDAIIREHCHRRITGDVVVIGRQTVNLAREELLELLKEHGVSPESWRTTTREDHADASEVAAVSAAELFQHFGAKSVRTLVRKFDGCWEGANVIQDLEKPAAQPLAASADFLVDGGALGDLFSPADALRNYASFLRPGGRLMLINNLSPHFDPYSTPSASWFFDYFVVNGFADCKVYVVAYFLDRAPNAFCLDTDCLLEPGGEVRNFLAPHETAVIVFAEIGQASTLDEIPKHPRLRSAEEWEHYRENLKRIKRSPRPHLVRSRSELAHIDVRGGHLFMRPDYTAVPVAEATADADDRGGLDAEHDDGAARELQDRTELSY